MKNIQTRAKFFSLFKNLIHSFQKSSANALPHPSGPPSPIQQSSHTPQPGTISGKPCPENSNRILPKKIQTPPLPPAQNPRADQPDLAQKNSIKPCLKIFRQTLHAISQSDLSERKTGKTHYRRKKIRELSQTLLDMLSGRP